MSAARGAAGAALLCASCLCALPVLAQSAPEAKPTAPVTWSIWTENDQYALVSARSERWYTQGLGVQRIAAWGAQDHRVWSLTHQMYTPASTRVLDPQPADRPYAGVLQAGWGVYRVQADRRLDLGLSLGVIGPSAGAGAVQRSVHQLLGQPRPQGWRYQLPDQPWLQGTVSQVSRLVEIAPGRTDLLVQTGLELGHPRNAAQVGLALRTGVLPMAPHWPGRPTAAVHATTHWMAHAGATLHGVLSDALLEGEPQDSNSLIRRRRTVLEASAGASWRVLPSMWLDAAVIWRERDFNLPTEAALPGSQRWGRIQLRWLSD